MSVVKTTAAGVEVQNPDVIWSISGNNTGDGGTTINQTGKITVGNEVYGTVLTVTATSADNEKIYDTIELPVTVPGLEASTYFDQYYFNPGESASVELEIPEGSFLENAELKYSIT